jgi:hypothetical protein
MVLRVPRPEQPGSIAGVQQPARTKPLSLLQVSDKCGKCRPRHGDPYVIDPGNNRDGHIIAIRAHGSLELGSVE